MCIDLYSCIYIQFKLVYNYCMQPAIICNTYIVTVQTFLNLECILCLCVYVWDVCVCWLGHSDVWGGVGWPMAVKGL